MSKFYPKSFFILGLFLFLASCSSSSDPIPTDKVLLGSFSGFYNAQTGAVEISPKAKSVHGLFVGQTYKGSPNALLGWDDSVDKNQNLVSVVNCTASDFNTSTKVLSHNWKITNKITSTSVIVPSLEFRITGVYGSTPSGLPNGALVTSSGFITRINTDLAGQNCANPLTLSTCDGDTNGYFDYIYPWEDSTVLSDSTYQNDPGWDFSLLMGGDNRLVAGESTTCKFMQFTVSNITESFGFYFDVLGKIEGSGLAAPTVGALTSPTNTLSPNIIVTLSGVGDTTKISGGAAIVSCKDGDVCDTNVSVGVVTVAYTLSANTTNNLSVIQIDTDVGPNVESASTSFSVVHDNTAPSIISSIPSNGATNISPNATLLISFDGALEAASVTTTNVLLNRDGGVGDCSTFGVNVGRAVSLPTTSEILITPSSALQSNTIHCIRLVGLTGPCDGSNEIRDLATNCLATTQTRKFTTISGNDNVKPFVTGTIPQDGAANISLNSNVQVLFSEAMLGTTLTSTTLIVQNNANSVAVAGTRTFSSDGITATFTPSSALAANTTYKVRVTTGATDLAGNVLLPGSGTEFFSYFTTGSTTDTTGPQIVSFYPPIQATNVNENIRPQITFNEPMSPATINTTNIHMQVKSTNAPVPLSVSLSSDGLTATVVPNSALALNTLYLVSVEFGCQDIAGNSLQSPQTDEFTTQSSADTSAPTVTRLTPSDNSSNVSIYTGVVVSFSEQINPNFVHTGTLILEDITNTPGVAVSGTVTVAADGLSATYKQTSAPLSKNTNYKATVKGGSSGCSLCVKDLAGNPLAVDATATFNTEFQNLLTPSVIGVAPGNGATGVAVNSGVVVTFSQTMDPVSVADATVYLTIPPSTTHVAGTVRLLSDGINARFSPSANLSTSTTYQVNTTTGVKDLAGLSTTAFTSTFTTSSSSAGDSTGPVLSSASSNGTSLALSTPFSTAVLRWPSVLLTFDEPMDPSTVNIINNVELIKNSDSTKVPMNLSMSSDSRTVIVNPTSLLGSSTSYTINLKQGLQNLSGLSLQSFTTFQFTTADTSADVTAPKVVSVSPANGATNQSTSVVTTITLSEAIDPDTIINGLVSITPQGGNAPPKGDLTISLDSTRKIITITPITVYQNNKTQKIRLKISIVDDANNGLSCSASTVGGCDTPSNPTDWISSFGT